MKLSVIVMAYNHEAFVEKAIESVLAQRTDFPFEILIADDYSTDGTARIVTGMESAHPGLVRVLRRGRNLGMQSNFIDAYGQCRGEYVATLDGDDYWTSADKLQTQVEFLDRHPEYSFCFHNVSKMSDGPSPEARDVLGRTDRDRFELDDLVVDNFVPFGSVVARAGLIREFSPWVLGIHGIDWIFGMLNATHGPFARVDGTRGVYRIHGGGAWSSLSRVRQIETIQTIYRGIRGELPNRVWPLIDTLIRNCELELYARELQSVVQSDQQNASTLQGRYAELEDYAKKLSAKYERMDTYTKDLQTKFTRLESTHAELTQKYVTLETFLQDNRAPHEFREKYQALEDYASELRRKYEEMESYAQTLQKKYDAIESTLRDLQSRYAQVEAYSHELQDLLTLREAELDRARERFESDHVRFERERQEFDEKYRTLESYASGLSQKYEAVETYAKALKEKYESLESTMRGLQGRYATVETYARELQTLLTRREDTPVGFHG